jgi:hypothetical protein
MRKSIVEKFRDLEDRIWQLENPCEYEKGQKINDEWMIIEIHLISEFYPKLPKDLQYYSCHWYEYEVMNLINGDRFRWDEPAIIRTINLDKNKNK